MKNSKSNKPGFPRPHSFWARAVVVVCACCLSSESWLAFGQDTEDSTAIEGSTYYVRSTVGKDTNDGMSPETAWATVSRGALELGPGDTLIIGPGTYRESVKIERGGLPGKPVRILGDASGNRTGDPPGPVIMAGSVPVDESIFEPEGSPGVFKASIPDFVVWTVADMEGPQYRYKNVREPESDIPYLERVRALPASAWYVRETSTLYVHTSDGKPPTDHEFELIRHHSAFHMLDKPYVWFGGLTLRHYVDGTIVFRDSDHGRVFNTVAFGGRQGVRVRNSKQVQIVDNVMFSNENSGVYFLVESLGGLVQGNLMYENAVGIRFSSASSAGLVLNNLALDNKDAGISFEEVNFSIADNNSLRGNGAQLRLRKASFFSDNNCFEPVTDPDKAFSYDRGMTTKALAEFSSRYGQDLNSREGGCGINAEKIDVWSLHQEALSYPERAQKILGSDEPSQND